MKKDGYMSVRMPAAILDALRQAAQKDSRTIAGQVLHIIKQWMAAK